MFHPCHYARSIEANLLDDGIGGTLVSPAFIAGRKVYAAEKINSAFRAPRRLCLESLPTTNHPRFLVKDKVTDSTGSHRTEGAPVGAEYPNHEPIVTMYQFAAVDGANGSFREVSPKLP